MEIKYTNKIPDINSFFSLYETTGWNDKNRTKEELFQAINKSWYILSAYYDENLIGFGRITSDGRLHAFIVDLIISPNFKKQKIGSEILHRLTNEILKEGITDIQLFCAKGKKNFYLKNNFSERPNDAQGMQYNI